jgi:Holliday junction resolvasome RuvABC DNA-binding subunit
MASDEYLRKLDNYINDVMEAEMDEEKGVENNVQALKIIGFELHRIANALETVNQIMTDK